LSFFFNIFELLNIQIDDVVLLAINFCVFHLNNDIFSNLNMLLLLLPLCIIVSLFLSRSIISLLKVDLILLVVRVLDFCLKEVIALFELNRNVVMIAI